MLSNMLLFSKQRINISSHHQTDSFYVVIRNMSHSRRQIQLIFLFHLQRTSPFTLHVPRLLIYRERLSVSTSSTETWRIGKPLTQAEPLHCCWNMLFPIYKYLGTESPLELCNILLVLSHFRLFHSRIISSTTSHPCSFKFYQSM